MAKYLDEDKLLEDIEHTVVFTLRPDKPSSINAELRGANKIIDRIQCAPAADVVDGEAYRELLKAARKMHCWIFLNTADELDAYDECGLTDEMNALLGYGGQFTANMDGGVNDGAQV